MTEGVVDVLEAIAVEKQHRGFFGGFVQRTQRPRQPAFKVAAIGQVGQRVVIGLMRQGLVFVLQVALP